MTVLDDADAVAQEAARLMADHVRSGARTLVLAGGSTPIRSYRLLAEMPVEWGRVELLFGDERCVSPDHADSNFRAARDALLDRVAPATVYRIPGELGAEAAADAYERVVSGVGELDLVLLGIGPDGHTASLFPDHPALRSERLVAAVHDAPKPPPDRVTLTLRCLRMAKQVVFLVTGEDKAQALVSAEQGIVPAGMIPGATWLVDRAAAARVSAGA